jgi:hypothetical protein
LSIQVFVSFDVQTDAALYEQLLEQSRAPGSSFAVSGGSELSAIGTVTERVRRRIREADQVIVICNEHTEESTSVGAELRVAQDEGTPYFLLWGRRETMCTKPIGAKPAEGMYSWTRQILADQIAVTSRKGSVLATGQTFRNAVRKS